MSKWTPSGILKAKHNPAYRDPKFFGGLCCVCRKRQRNYRHEHYPHMCDKCRESRIFTKDLPFTHPEVASNIRDYDLKVHGPTPTDLPISQEVRDALMREGYLRGKQQESIQSLNAPRTAPITDAQRARKRIEQVAALFRRTREPITDEMRAKINASAERFRNTLKK